MKTLVTGGTGLLGSHIVEALLERDHQVRALVRKTSDTSHLETTGAGIVYGDVEDYDSLSAAVSGIELVFHSASKVTPGWGKWEDFRDATIKGTENLLRASTEASVSRFLYVSSASVYDSSNCGDTPLTECSSCEVAWAPDAYYNYAKLKAEEKVFECQRQGKLNVTVIRPQTIYGPRDRFGTDRMYTHMGARIILWPGKGNARIAPVYVSDVAECAVVAAPATRPSARSTTLLRLRGHDIENSVSS